MAARVHAHCSPDRARDTDGPFKADQAGGDTSARQHRQRHRRTSVDDGVVEAHPFGHFRQRDGDTGEARVGNQQIRPAAHHQRRQLRVANDFRDEVEILVVAWCREHRGRAADPIGRIRRKRLVGGRERTQPSQGLLLRCAHRASSRVRRSASRRCCTSSGSVLTSPQPIDMHTSPARSVRAR